MPNVNRRHVTRLVSKFRTHGTVCNLPHVRDRTVLSPAIEKVREVLTVNPTKSLRRVTKEENLRNHWMSLNLFLTIV